MATEVRNRTLDHLPSPFPEGFGERLERLKEMSGLSWGEFAERIGVTQTGLRKWRRKEPPSMAYFWAIIDRPATFSEATSSWSTATPERMAESISR